MPSIAEKIAAKKQQENAAQIAADKQTKHDELVEEFGNMMASFTFVTEIVYPNDLDDFDIKIAEKFNKDFKEMIDHLSQIDDAPTSLMPDAESTQQPEPQAPNQPRRQRQGGGLLKTLGSGIKKGVTHIP